MEMQHVRYFIAICEERNFTRAAKRCGLSQPSLTNGIKRVEDEIGGPLFKRNKRGGNFVRLRNSSKIGLV